MGGLAIIVFSKCCGFKAVAYGASPHYINCYHLKTKEQFKELKGRTRTGYRYETKIFKIVVEKSAIINLFLIPLWHRLVLIPWVRLILTLLLRFTYPVLLWYFKDRFLCKNDFGSIANCIQCYIRSRVKHSSVFSAPFRRMEKIWNLHVHKRERVVGRKVRSLTPWFCLSIW